MYYLFSKNLIYNKRITAYDVNKIEGYDDIEYNKFNEVNKPDYCLSFSHLKAIQTSYENNDEISIICEDDLCTNFKDKWKRNLDDIVKTAPNDWEVIKIVHNNDGEYLKI